MWQAIGNALNSVSSGLVNALEGARDAIGGAIDGALELARMLVLGTASTRPHTRCSRRSDSTPSTGSPVDAVGKDNADTTAEAVVDDVLHLHLKQSGSIMVRCCN